MVTRARERSPGGKGGRQSAAPSDRDRLPALLTAGCLVLLIASVPTGLYHRLRPSSPTRRFHLGEAAWYAHSAAEFLNRKDSPKNIYAAHEGAAAICIYHLGPRRRVFADARLEVNTRETLERYLVVKRQLARGDPAAEANLVRDIPPGPDGQREMPALLFDNRTLFHGSLVDPPLLQGILQSGRWRCVFCDTKGTVFMAPGFAEQIGLPAADTSLLEMLIDAARAGQSRQDVRQ